MAWSFDVASNIPRLNQSGTETGLAGIATAIAAQATVARSTAYTTAQMVKPPTPTGFWYRCSTAGTTAAAAPTYGTTLAGTTTDGTAVFTAFKAPDIQTLGTTNHYYMPDIRMAINGTLTNANVQQQNFTCYDLIIFTGNFTSGAYASDGVTPVWDGLHFAAVRSSASGADGTSMSLQSGGQFTFIGGEVQTAGGVTFDNGTTPRSYLTRWRNTKEYGASSARFRSSAVNAIFQNVEAYDFAFDLFRMPTVAPSIKARGAEYVYQYVGASGGGADARFVASNLENPNGTYDFDNYFGGWIELYNCAKGANLSVVSQYPNSAIWVKHCVPLYQDIAITAKDTAGAVVQDVRFTATESPTNSPTVTFTTASGLKTWDFRTPLSYQTTTNASGIATTSPVLNVWYWQTSFKTSLRFPSSTAVYQGRAYNYKTLNVSALLGASAAVPVSAGMISLDTATTVSEATALADTGITFVASGATGGTVTVSSNRTLQEVWNSYRAYTSQFANRASNDTWTCVAGALSMGAWNVVINSGVTVSGTGSVTSFATTGSVTNNGSITAIYTSSAGTSSTLQLVGVTNNGVAAVWHPSTLATELFQTNVSGSAATYTVYYPPGSTGLVKNYARELFGSQRVAGSITLAAGLNTLDFVDIPDVGIANTSQSAVTAYAGIEGPSKRYDRTAILRLTEQGIKLGQIATRSGTSLEGTYSVVVRDDAPAVMSVLGNVITIKAESYAADDKYDTETVTGGGTFTAYDTEVITVEIVDANGDSSLTIQGGSGNNEVWKVANGTPEDQFATGTLLAATVSTGKWRFTGTAGFYLLVRDKAKNNRDTATMEKGTYTIGLYAGKSQISVAQLPEVYELQDDMALVKVLLDAVKGAGFDTTLDSLKAIRAAVDATPALADIEASTVLANKTDVLNVTAAVWSAESRTLTSAGSSGATLAEIEASSVLAKQTDVAGVPAAVRTELSTELGRVDVAVSTRSTLTAQDIPVGLTASEVWAATERTLTETPGLPTTQAEQLRKVAQLHGVGAELVVTATARIAGDVSQTITSTEDQTTVSSA